MKRFVSILLVMALTLVCALAAVSCGDSSSSGKTKIAIVQPMDHTSLNQIRDTIISTLKDLGYDDSNSEIILKNASNDAPLDLLEPRLRERRHNHPDRHRRGAGRGFPDRHYSDSLRGCLRPGRGTTCHRV